MSSCGIYTLANDVVYDQLVALLNSIEVNISPDIPVCVIPYDDRLEKVKGEIESRDNVTLFDNSDSIRRWEAFARKVWSHHPTSSEKHSPKDTKNKICLHRKFVSFDGEFDKFVFYDADSLAMKPISEIYNRLDRYDFIFDDWEHKKTIENAALNIPEIEKNSPILESEIRQKLHCSSFFASRKGFFGKTELIEFENLLIQGGEVTWINNRYCDDAFLFNYLTLRCDRRLFNYTLSPDGQERTGNCADADPFVNIDNVLYNQEGLKPIHRIHYMNYPSEDFAQLSRGQDVGIKYQDIFLHYRFLKEPENKPNELKNPDFSAYVQRMKNKAIKKLKKMINW